MPKFLASAIRSLLYFSAASEFSGVVYALVIPAIRPLPAIARNPGFSWFSYVERLDPSALLDVSNTPFSTTAYIMGTLCPLGNTAKSFAPVTPIGLSGYLASELSISMSLITTGAPLPKSLE